MVIVNDRSTTVDYVVTGPIPTFPGGTDPIKTEEIYTGTVAENTRTPPTSNIADLEANDKFEVAITKASGGEPICSLVAMGQETVTVSASDTCSIT